MLRKAVKMRRKKVSAIFAIPYLNGLLCSCFCLSINAGDFKQVYIFTEGLYQGFLILNFYLKSRGTCYFVLWHSTNLKFGNSTKTRLYYQNVAGIGTACTQPRIYIVPCYTHYWSHLLTATFAAAAARRTLRLMTIFGCDDIIISN